MNRALVDALTRALPGQVERDAPSAPLTTYRCGGRIAVLVRAGRVGDLAAVAGVLADESVCGPGAPVLVVGRGSNLLVADGGFDGVAILLDGDFEHLDLESARDTGRVAGGAAVPLPVLARRTAAAGLAGLEFFVGIPGSVGGAIRMNAGGHGRETKDVLLGARVCSLDDGQVHVVEPAVLELGYRHSALTPRTVVLDAVFAVSIDDPSACTARVDEIVRWRREHQPGGQNAGSVFVNPPGGAAGRIIDECGLKGLRAGAVVVSTKHANFFVAEPGATATDVHALVRAVQERVEAATGVRLVPELHLVGFETEVAGQP